MKKYAFGARGWFLVLFGMLIIVLCTAIPATMNLAVNMFVEKGFNRTVLLSLQSYGGYGALIWFVVLGFITKGGKTNYRYLEIAVGLIWAVSVALWGIIPNQAGFVTIYIISFLCSQTMSLIVVNNLVANWFPKKKALVIGLITIGFTLGAGTGVLLFTTLLKNFGFVGSYVFYGVAIAVLTVLGFVILRNYPEECGGYPDNDHSMTREQADAMLAEGKRLAANSPWTKRRLLSTWQTWVLGINLGCGMFLASAVPSQLIPRLLEAGYERPTAIAMMSACAFIGCFGSWFIGALDDKIGTKPAQITMLICGAVACVFTTLGVTALMWIALILLGAILGGSSNFSTSFTVRFWGRYNFQNAYSVIVVICQLFGSAGAMVTAMVAARSGYNVAYLVLAGVCILAIVLIIPIKDGFVAKREKEFKEEKC